MKQYRTQYYDELSAIAFVFNKEGKLFKKIKNLFYKEIELTLISLKVIIVDFLKFNLN